MTKLTDNDLRYVVTRVPKDIRALLTNYPGKLFLGGGFIRATIAGETPSDIDLFGTDEAFLDACATILKSGREGSKIHRTKSAITLLASDRLSIQFITRWTFSNADDLIKSFDFTVCQAAIWRTGSHVRATWASSIGDYFYIDLAGRRLVYTSPVREEEAGGSMLRVIKYVKRGYSIQVHSLGNVMARMFSKVRDSSLATTEEGVGRVLGGLLREVDPLLVVDGLEISDDHEPEEPVLIEAQVP